MSRAIGTNYFPSEKPPTKLNVIDNFNQNTKRTDVYAQSLALLKGEVLPNKWMVADKVINTNDGARIPFANKNNRYIAQRLPLTLGRLASPETLPQDLRRGDVLYTGDVVLDDPEEAQKIFHDSDQQSIVFAVSGGQRPQLTFSPDDLYLARFGTLDDLERAPNALVTATRNKLAHLRKSLLAKAMGEFPILEELMADKHL